MKSRVLVVGQDHSISNSLCKILEAAEYAGLHACDGREALELCASNPIDLLILDLDGLPDPGWAALERLTDFDPMLPIIVLTGLVDQPDAGLAAHIGAVLEKPVDVPVLLQTLEGLLSESRETRWRRLAGCFAKMPWRGSPSTQVLKELRERVSGRAPSLPYRSMLVERGAS